MVHFYNARVRLPVGRKFWSPVGLPISSITPPEALRAANFFDHLVMRNEESIKSQLFYGHSDEVNIAPPNFRQLFNVKLTVIAFLFSIYFLYIRNNRHYNNVSSKCFQAKGNNNTILEQWRMGPLWDIISVIIAMRWIPACCAYGVTREFGTLRKHSALFNVFFVVLNYVSTRR